MKYNPVAKNAHKFNKAQVHKDRKKAEKKGERKHKGKAYETVEEERNYKKEYENYHSRPEQKKRRAARNGARRMLKDRKNIKGMDVHHKDNDPMNNDKSNLSIVTQKYNRTEPRLRKEELGPNAKMSDYIKDFETSDAPQFKGKSAEKRKEMAIAAYLDAKKGPKEEKEEVSEWSCSRTERTRLVKGGDKRKKYMKEKMRREEAKNAAQQAAIAISKKERGEIEEDLRKWFGKGKKGDWVRVGTDGEIKGDCARDEDEGKPKCMPRDRAHGMSKKDRASAARRKRHHDPDADRPGTGNKPIMVKTKKESVEEAMDFDTFNKQYTALLAKQKTANDALKKARGSKRSAMGMTPDDVKRSPKFKKAKADYEKITDEIKKFLKGVPNDYLRKSSKMRRFNTRNESLEEKNEPTNPALWAKFKAQAKAKFDVYPSAYANGWAAKQYKAAGGGWKTTKESIEEAKYEVKNGKIHISKSEFRKVHRDFKNTTRGKERMMANDPKTGGSASYEVVFTKESIEEAKKSGLDVAREVVKTKSAKDGIDLTTAGAIIQVYDKLKRPDLRKRFEGMDPATLAHVVWKLVGKMKESVDIDEKLSLFDDEKKAREYAKKSGGKVIKGTGKSSGKWAVKEETISEMAMPRKEFEKLKKGDKLKFTFDSAMKKGHEVSLVVTGKSRSAKYDVDKVNMKDAGDPRNRTKFTLYSRKGGDATLAWGDAATVMQKYVKEGVDEASLRTSDYPKGTSMSAKKFKDSQKKMSKQRALSTKDYPKGTSMSATAWKNKQKEEVEESAQDRLSARAAKHGLGKPNKAADDYLAMMMKKYGAKDMADLKKKMGMRESKELLKNHITELTQRELDMIAQRKAGRTKTGKKGSGKQVSPEAGMNVAKNKGDDHIVMQLRKAQDVNGNFDIKVSPTGKSTRLPKKMIDKLLATHDKLQKPDEKRKFRIMVTKELRKRAK